LALAIYNLTSPSYDHNVEMAYDTPAFFSSSHSSSSYSSSSSSTSAATTTTTTSLVANILDGHSLKNTTLPLFWTASNLNHSSGPKHKNAPLPQRISVPILLLHVGKAGGTTAHHRLNNNMYWNFNYDSQHPFPTQEAPKDYVAAAINIRDPIDRFISSYYFQQKGICQPGDTRKPSPKNPHAWTRLKKLCIPHSEEMQELLFSQTYNRSASGLAHALGSSNATKQTLAESHLAMLDHARIKLVDWLHYDWKHSNVSRIFPLVLEKHFSLDQQVDDLVQWTYEQRPFENAATFAQRLHAVTKRGYTPQRMQSGKPPNHGFSSQGLEAVLQYYKEDYRLLEELRQQACVTRLCYNALASILQRRGPELKEFGIIS